MLRDTYTAKTVLVHAARTSRKERMEVVLLERGSPAASRKQQQNLPWGMQAKASATEAVFQNDERRRQKKCTLNIAPTDVIIAMMFMMIPID